MNDHAGVFVARLLLTPIFLTSGIGKVTAWESNLAYVGTRHLPAAPLLLGLAALVEIVGSGCIIIGWRTRAAALVMAGYTAVLTAIFHDFWNAQGMSGLMQRTQFLENVAIIGGLLVLAGRGAGRLSFDAYTRRTS